MGFAVVDFVFAGVIVLFVLRCAVRGFVSEIMSLAALAVGLLSAIFFFRTTAGFIREKLMPEVATVPEVLAFLAIFILVFIVARIIESILKGVVRAVGLGGLDRFLGVALGLAEGLLVVCVLLFLVGIQPFFDSEAVLRGSFFAELLLPFILGRSWDLPGMIASRTCGGPVNV